MSLSIKDVENLAELAKLELTQEEKESLLHDMDSILGYVKQIERPSAEVDGSIELSSEAPRIYNVWREDILEPREFSKELIVEQFPDSQDGFLKVKKIL